MSAPFAKPDRCRGPLGRREWLKLGGLSLGALAAGGGPHLSQLLAEEAVQGPLRDDFSVILFWANGGPSQLETFDLKPEAPLEYRGPFQPIRTNVPGIEINERLPLLARMADKFTLVRSLHHDRAEHSGGTHRFLTGYPSRAANLQDSEFPELGSIVSKMLHQRRQEIPPFVANTKFYGSGPAYLGATFAPYMPNPNPRSSTGDNQYDPIPIYRKPGSADNLAISDEAVVTLRRRSDLLNTLDRLPRIVDHAGTMASLDEFNRRALEILSSGRTRAAFDLSREPESVQARYGQTHWGKSLLTCRRLVEAGVRFVQCQAEFRLPADVGVTSNFDDHSVNSDIFRSYELKFPHFDQSVSALIEDLADRGLDQRVLFIFCGEFGRTPRIAYQDASKRPGRDHWPSAMSIFLAGGGLKMGQVIGATNRRAEVPIDRIMHSNCLLATIYHRFGIDVRHSFLDFSGRPHPILPEGSPIPELL